MGCPVHTRRTHRGARSPTDEQPGTQHGRVSRAEHHGRSSSGSTKSEVGELSGHPVQITEIPDRSRGSVVRFQAGGSIRLGRIRQAVADLAQHPGARGPPRHPRTQIRHRFVDHRGLR